MSSVDHKQPHPLSLAALASWTALHPPSASTAVAAYLAQQAGRTYSPDVTPNSPSSTRSPPAPDRSRRHEHVEDVRETAMVLGGRDVRESDLAPKAPRGPKTATLVGAMKARTSTTLPLSPSKGIKKVQRDSSSSPFIAARNDARSTYARAEKENAPVAALTEGTSKDKARRKREIVVVDPEPKPASKRAKPVESDSSEQDADAVARTSSTRLFRLTRLRSRSAQGTTTVTGTHRQGSHTNGGCNGRGCSVEGQKREAGLGAGAGRERVGAGAGQGQEEAQKQGRDGGGEAGAARSESS